MNTSILSLLIFLLILSASFNCKSQTNDSDNYVIFKIDSPPNMRPTEVKFKTADYRFPIKSVYVMEGSNSGIEIEFQKKETDTNTLSLFFMLPSGNAFQVYSKYKGYEYKVPEIPCTITNEDFKGIKSSRVHMDVLSYIYLSRNIRLAPNHSSVESVYFEIFSINIKEFNIKEDKINFSCTFTGELSENQLKVQDTNYKISGEFSIKDFEVSIMMVDD
jgi:hypothetical protein